MIKSVRFKNKDTSTLHLHGRVISANELTPELYVQLVQADSKLHALFEVERYEEKKFKTKTDKNDSEAEK